MKRVTEEGGKKKMRVIPKILATFLIVSTLLLTGCQVTLEQGELLEQNNKLPEATQLYWEIVKGDPGSYSLDTKQEAKKRILKLKPQTIVPELKNEILSNKDSNSKLLMCDMIIAYNNTPDYNCIILAGLAEKSNLAAKKYYANSLAELESEEITTKIILQYNEASKHYINDLKEQKNKGATLNLSSDVLLSYYQFVALYNQPKTLDFLLSLLQSKDVLDRQSLIKSMELISDKQIIEPLLSISKPITPKEQEILTKIFLNLNDPKTYSFLISQATTSTKNEKVIIEHLEKNINKSNLKHIAQTFKDNDYQLNNDAVLLAKSLIKTVPSKEAVSALSQLLQLKDVTKNQITLAEVQDILYFINRNMTKDNLSDMLSALDKNLSIKSTSDFYALDDLFQQNVNLINKFYGSNNYLQSFMLELKTLASVYKAKENFATSVQKARSSQEIEAVKLLLEDIILQTETLTSSQPASKLLNNVKFFVSKIEDADLKKLLNSIIKNSQYEKVIAPDDSLNTLNVPDLIQLISPSVTTTGAND